MARHTIMNIFNYYVIFFILCKKKSSSEAISLRRWRFEVTRLKAESSRLKGEVEGKRT
jgi:hypothetical protein